MQKELLLSIVNTLLRDKCSDLKALALYLDEEYRLELSDVTKQLEELGYFYQVDVNQFTSKLSHE